jgi:hypothetical protein
MAADKELQEAELQKKVTELEEKISSVEEEIVKAGFAHELRKNEILKEVAKELEDYQPKGLGLNLPETKNLQPDDKLINNILIGTYKLKAE